MNNNDAINVSSFIRSIAKFSISSWTGFFLGIISVSITTRVFTPDIVGVINIFNSTIYIFISFAVLGMGSAFARFFYEPPLGWTSKELFTRCLFIAVVFLVFCSFLLVTDFANDFFKQVFKTNSCILRFLFFANALSMMVMTYFFSQYYRYSNDAYNFNIQQILIQFFSKIFVIIAAFIDPTIELVLAFNAIGIVLLMILYVAIHGKSLFVWKKRDWCGKDIIQVYRFAIFSWPNEIVQHFSVFILLYLITTYLGVKELGIYSSANFFVSALGVLQGGFRTYWAAFMYKYYKTEKSKITKIHSYISLGIITLMGGCIIFQHLAYLLIGEAYHGSRLFFTLVLIPPLLGLWEQTTSYGIALSKKNEQFMIINILSIVLNVFAIYVCIQKWGLLGAAMGVSFAAVVRYMLLTWRGQIYYRSIQSTFETITGLLILIVLAASNVFLYEDYILEVSVTFLFFIIIALLYRNSLREIGAMIHRREK